MYDLKNMLEQTKNPVPVELARHPAAAVKPGTVVDRPRRDTKIFAAGVK
jgi:hypothetical protein